MRRTTSALLRLPKLSTLILAILTFSTLSFAAAPDRVTGAIDSSQMVRLTTGVNFKAKPKYDKGPVDPSLQFNYVTLLTVPSASQHSAMLRLLVQQQDPHSAQFHKWLTPEQYADQFGLSQNDVSRITQWLKSQGLTVLTVARGRNWITFSGTAAQIESAFHTEIHNYQVAGKMYVANSTLPSVPAALSGIVSGFRGLSNFGMKPMGSSKRANRFNQNYFDSNFSVNFVAPGDISTIYNLTPLYTAGTDGTGQKLAVVGQTDVYLADLNDFRSGFGLNQISGCTLNASNVITACNSTNFQYVVPQGITDPGTPSSCGDLSEADLDLEWTGATARNAQIVYVNAPVVYDSNCNQVSSGGGVGAAFYDAIDNQRAPVISMSYGICELGEASNGAFESDEEELQMGNSLGITFVSSSGDVGAAGCDEFFNPDTDPPNLAVYGLQVNYPASSPEVTGVGGTALSYTNLAGAPYWSESNGSDGGSAQSYIPELAWNDTFEFSAFCTANPTNSFCVNSGISTPLDAQEALGIGSGGGGASACTSINENTGACLGGFPRPSWQNVTVAGAPANRLVPDASLLASPNFPGYIFCTPLSELGGTGSTSSCANGIADAINTNLSIVGGTSVSTPIFAGIVALLNQSFVGPSSPGLGNIDPMLYSLAKNAPTAFQQVTTGNNMVYCLPGTPDFEPSALQCSNSGILGYNASTFDSNTGYNLVTGLGSLNVNNLVTAWAAARTTTTITVTVSATQIFQGQSVTLTAMVSPSTATGQVTFTTTNNSTTTTLGTGALTNGVATLSTTSLPAGSNDIGVSYPGDGYNAPSTPVSEPTVNVVVPDFKLTNTGATTATALAGVPATGYAFTVAPLAPATTFGSTVTFSCSFSPTDPTLTNSSCVFNPTSIPGTSGPTPVPVTLTITTAGPNTAGSGARQNKRADNRSPWLPLTLPIAGVVVIGLIGRKVSKYSAFMGVCLTLVMLGLLIACGSDSHPVTVAVSPATASLWPNNTADGWPSSTQSFTATVGNTSNTAVTWSISPGTAGSIDANGNYTAPTVATGLPSTVSVTATSQADSTKMGTGTITLKPATVPGPYSVTVTVTNASTPPISHTLPAYTLNVQ